MFAARIAIALALAFAWLVPTAGRAQAEPRLDLASGLCLMTTEACQRVYSDLDWLAVERCIDEHLAEHERSNESLAREGGEGEHICLDEGGMLLSRIDACTDAMTDSMAAERDDDTGAFFRAIGEVMQACHADRLCRQ